MTGKNVTTIELYGLASPNVVKIMIMLEEIGAPFQMKYVDVFKQEQFDPAFARLSPTNKVPVIVDPDGPGGAPISIFESGAILIYLAEKSGRFLPTEPRARARVLEWLMVQISLMGPMGGQAVHFSLFAPPGNEYAQERYNSQCANVQRMLDKRLGEASYLGGEEISIADIATFPWMNQNISFFPWLQDDDGAKLRTYFPNLGRWYEGLRQRPAFDRALTMRDKSARLSTMDKATPSTVDHFTMRGEFSAVPVEARGLAARYKR